MVASENGTRVCIDGRPALGIIDLIRPLSDTDSNAVFFLFAAGKPARFVASESVRGCATGRVGLCSLAG